MARLAPTLARAGDKWREEEQRALPSELSGPNKKAENRDFLSDSRPLGLERATRIELATFSLGS